MTIILYQITHNPVIPISGDLPAQIQVKIKGENGNYWRYQLINEVGVAVVSSDWTQLTTDDFTTQVLDGTEIGGLSEGTYVFKVDVSTQPNENNIIDSGSIVLFLVNPTNTYLASLGTDIGELFILDNYIGASYRIGGVTGSVSCPIGGRFSSLLYLHNPEKKQGKLIIPLSSSEAYDTGWGTYAIINFSLGFNDIVTMKDWLYRIAYLHSQNKGYLLDIYENPNITDTDKIKLLAPYVVKHMIQYLDGRCLGSEVDTTNYKITYSVYVRLGFANIDWGKLLAVIGIAAGIAVIAIGTAMTGGALGIGLVAAGGFIAGASTSYLVIRDTSKPPTDSEKAKIYDEAKIWIEKTKNVANEALQTLDHYHETGDISDTAYNALKSEIEKLRDTAIQGIQEVADEGARQTDNAYNEGYNDAKEDYLKWVAVSGIAGLGFGYMMGKR